MAREKTASISETKHVMLTITHENRSVLAAYEVDLMKKRGLTDCLKVPNADVINEAISDGYINKKGRSK